MIKQYTTQALAQLRQHPIISAVSIIGTALAIFLIMLVVMMQQVKTAPFAPESNRDRFLHVHYMSISNENWKGNGGQSNGPMSERTIKELFQSLKTPEAVTIYTCMTVSMAQFSLKRVRLNRSNFIQALTDKLYWGEDVRNIK